MSSKQVRVGVGVIIMRENKMLLGLRQGSHGEGTWALPGGHLEFGETIEICAAREVMEETGLMVTHITQLGFTNDIFSKGDKHYITLFVQAKANNGEAKVLEPEKCIKWQWFAMDNLPRPLFLPLDNLLKKQNLLADFV